jgi:hypothetical protein
MCIISFHFFEGLRSWEQSRGCEGKKKKTKKKTNKTNGGMGGETDHQNKKPSAAASKQSGLLDKTM